MGGFMLHVIVPQAPGDFPLVSARHISHGLLVQDPARITKLIFNTYLLMSPHSTGILASCWGQDLDHILESIVNPQRWAGYFNSLEMSMPTLAHLIANTIYNPPEAVHVFTMLDPEDGVRKWFIGKRIDSYDQMDAQMMRGVKSNPQSLPEAYQEVIALNKRLVEEHIQLANNGQPLSSLTKAAAKAMFAAPKVPMPSPASFGVTGPPPSQKPASSLNQGVKVVEKIVDVGQAMTGGLGSVAASGGVSILVEKTADHVKEPFSEHSEGDQKVNRMMPAYLLIFLPFALLTLLFQSPKPLGFGIALIGVYFIVTAKAILSLGASLAYFQGRKARFVGIVVLLLGLVILLAV
jgi:hypothetical protein